MLVIVFVTALVTLALEVFFTRLFSAMFWKDMASAILSLAMLGIGASGVLVYLAPKWFRKDRVEHQVTWWTLAFGVSIVVSYLLVLELSTTTQNMLAPVWGFGPLIFAALIPFFTGGAVLSLVFTHRSENIARLYLFDLVGASLGALAVLPAIVWLNGPAVIPVLALIPIVTALWHARKIGAKPALIGSAIGALAVGGVLVTHLQSGWMKVTHAEGRPEVAVILERWDPVARITVHQPRPDATWFHIDARVATAVLQYDGNPESVSYLKENVLQLGYHLGPYDDVVIIGPGGGSDVLSALTFGNRKITGVEVNRAMIDIMRDELSDYTGGLYDRPEVDIQIADGRAYVAGMDRKVDLIQATFIDTVAASAAGAHTLSENYLYTTEAMHDFLDHLTDDGVLAMSRWGGVDWGFSETHRVLSFMRKAYEERGVANPETHIIAVRGPDPEQLRLGRGYQTPVGDMESMTAVLAKNSPFTPAEVEKIRGLVETSKYRPIWIAGHGVADPVVADLFASKGSQRFYDDYFERTGLNISPPTDDHPFFFDMIDPIDSLLFQPAPEWTAYPYYWAISVGIGALHQLLGATSVLVLLLILLPLATRWRDLKGVRRPASVLGYFVCLGLAFIGIEINLMQRFSLFLEHPVYALVVVLTAVLLFSGIGSAHTERIEKDHAGQGARRMGILVGILAVYGVVLPYVTPPLMGWPLVLKALVAVAIAVPPAYLMGMMFPLGIAAIRTTSERLVPWVWGLNTSFSVLGAIVSLFLAMSFGHTVSWYVFAAVYAIGGLLLFRVSRA